MISKYSFAIHSKGTDTIKTFVLIHFQEYELQKEFEKREKMREMDEEHRKQYEEEIRRQQSKHNKHEKVHHPGNKAQLEEGTVIFDIFH